SRVKSSTTAKIRKRRGVSSGDPKTQESKAGGGGRADPGGWKRGHDGCFSVGGGGFTHQALVGGIKSASARTLNLLGRFVRSSGANGQKPKPVSQQRFIENEHPPARAVLGFQTGGMVAAR